MRRSSLRAPRRSETRRKWAPLGGIARTRAPRQPTQRCLPRQATARLRSCHGRAAQTAVQRPPRGIRQAASRPPARTSTRCLTPLACPTQSATSESSRSPACGDQAKPDCLHKCYLSPRSLPTCDGDCVGAVRMQLLPRPLSRKPYSRLQGRTQLIIPDRQWTTVICPPKEIQTSGLRSVNATLMRERERENTHPLCKARFRELSRRRIWPFIRGSLARVLENAHPLSPFSQYLRTFFEHLSTG